MSMALAISTSSYTERFSNFRVAHVFSEAKSALRSEFSFAYSITATRSCSCRCCTRTRRPGASNGALLPGRPCVILHDLSPAAILVYNGEADIHP
jgi:hypothetical protein